MVDDFEEVELLLGRESARFAQVAAGVATYRGSTAVDFKRHALHDFARGDGLNFARNVLAVALEFGSKLGGDGVGAILIGLFERLAHGAIDRHRHHGDAKQNGGSEQEKQFLAEAHRESPSRASTNERSARFQKPSWSGPQPRTRALAALAMGRWKSGITLSS